MSVLFAVVAFYAVLALLWETQERKRLERKLSDEQRERIRNQYPNLKP